MKKNIKRLAAGLMVATLAGALFTACNTTGGGNTTEPAQTQVTGAQGNDTQTTTASSDDAQTTASSDDAQTTAYDGEVTVIHAATGGGPRPFIYVDDNGELTGHNIELIKAIFDRLPQYELEIELTEFAAIFTGIDAGYYQLGINNLAKNPEREEKVLFTDPQMANHYIVVANPSVDIDELTDLSQLANYTYLGGPGNDKTTVVENYNDEHPDNQINILYDSNNVQTQLLDIELGRADFLIIDAPMYFGYYEPEFHLNVKTFDLSGIKSGTYSYFVVGKQDTQLAEDINRALYEVVADGTAKAICEKYLGGDYSPSLDVLTGGNQ